MCRNRVAATIIPGCSERPFRGTSKGGGGGGGEMNREKGDEVVGAVINVGAIGTGCALQDGHRRRCTAIPSIRTESLVFHLVQDGCISCPYDVCCTECMHSSPDILWVMKSRIHKWVGYVARMGERRGAWRVSVGKPEGRRPLEHSGIDGRIIFKWILERLNGGHRLDRSGSG